MKVLPKSRASRFRLGLLLLILLGVCVYLRLDRPAAFYLSDKKEGDVVFQSLPRVDLVDAIETISESEWSHCGILFRQDGHWMVAEAFGQVRYTPLRLWILRGRGSRIVSYRYPKLDEKGLAAVRAAVDAMEGLSYDFRYAPEDDEIYCSELVEKGFDRALGIKLGRWQRLGDLNWKPKESFIREMEDGDLPLDRLMVTPVSLTRDPRMVRVH